MRLQSGTPEAAGMSAARIARIAELAANWVAQGITPALGLLVARRGIVVLHEAFGRLTPAPDAPPLQRDTIFPLNSLSKPVTATAAMILVDDGLLGLTSPVAKYIPEFAGEGKEAVLVHHLLSHTSGLREEDVFRHSEAKQLAGAKIPPPAATLHPKMNEWLYLGYDTPLWKPPGVEMSYTDYGYELIGEIVRRVGGKSLAAFARERIFAPLDMQDTWYILPDSVGQRVVRRRPDASWASPASAEIAELPAYLQTILVGLDSRELQELPSASDGVYSTMMDMARFGQMFLNRGRYGDTRVLSPAAVAAMTCNQIPGISASYFGEYFPEASWGWGWSVQGNKKTPWEGTLQSPHTFAHPGGGAVYLWVDPVYEIVGVYFSVMPKATEPRLDLFMNTATAAVIDG